VSKQASSGGGGIGCLGTSLLYVALFGIIGWAAYEMEPREAALWALWQLPYFWGGLCVFIAAVAGLLAIAAPHRRGDG
jgi:hypothetical protein